MTKNLFYATMAILAVLVLLSASLWYAFANSGSRMMGGSSVDGSDVDRHFIEQMIPHHEGAIAMAELALERTKRPEMRSLAEGIIAAQTREIVDMRAWYEAWYGEPAQDTTMGGMHMDSMEGDMAALSAVSEAQFDREFIEQMIPHHEMAVMMARMLAAGTARAEMQTLADQIITSQSREIEMMRSWLLSWY
ncbi:MAG TPA: DUF305 domain-containing protein [Candidatus Paceibacterota bacterium]